MAVNRYLSEEDTKNRYITVNLEKRGWKREQMMMEYPIKKDRHVINKNSFTTTKLQQNWKADYVLSYNTNCPIAVLEAKRYGLSDSEGIDQAIKYAKALDVNYAYSSSGTAFVEYNIKTGKQCTIALDKFPTPNELWQRFCDEKNIRQEQTKDLERATYYTTADRQPRYYQLKAINKTIDAILVEGKKRLLLVMATGTGKTYTAFQIVWRLLQSKKVTNILYLADRNQLVDQSITGDFKPLEKMMTKISKGNINKNYNIFFALYQQLSRTTTNEDDKEQENQDYFNYQQLAKDFFDLIIVDECHRGSAKETSAWRDILTYFDSAIQIGMTATPKKDSEGNNELYFGEPVFEYSLREGIEDGFLASYKVISHVIDKDEYGWEPDDGELDLNGLPIPKRLYTLKDFDRKIELQSRINLVAKKITEFLHQVGDMSKTIVFCASQRHALKMRDALRELNQEKMALNSNYIVRMTADDKEGKSLYDSFTGVYTKYPVIVTTSKLLTTGADTKCVKVIVLDAPIGSMIEFKQIIGRGTRLVEDNDKTFFTVLDFRGVTKLFYDPGFDGEIEIIDDLSSGSNGGKKEPLDIDPDPVEKDPIYELGTNIDVNIMATKVSFVNDEGNLIAEKYIDYTRSEILKLYGTKDNFIEIWNSTEEKEKILETLENDYNITIEHLEEALNTSAMDVFDMICYIAFNSPIISRKKRADNVRQSNFLDKYKNVSKKILNKILDMYLLDGIKEIESSALLKASEFEEYGGIVKIMNSFGGKDEYYEALSDLKDHIYQPIEIN